MTSDPTPPAPGSAEPGPTGALPGYCYDIDGDTWHKAGERCERCGFGMDPAPSAPDAGREAYTLDELYSILSTETPDVYTEAELVALMREAATMLLRTDGELRRVESDNIQLRADAATLAALRQENEVLRARVGEILDVTSAVEYGDLPSAGPWSYVQGMCRKMLGEQPTEPQPRTVNAIRLRLGLPLSERWPHV